MATTKNRIPSFRTDDQERKFWARHSLEEFAGELAELDVNIRPARTEQIALRLFPEDLAALRTLAREKGVGHTTLARSILEQWLERVREKVRLVQRVRGGASTARER